MTGLRRDGHASDLAIEQLALGVQLPEVSAHVANCAVCQARLDSLQPSARGWPRRVWATAATGLALAAVMLWMVVPGPPRRKGPRLDLQVWRDVPEGPQVLSHGDRVYPEDRLGFRVRSAVSGHLLVFGGDDVGHAGPYAPARGAAMAIEASSEHATLPYAIRLDDEGQRERIVALWCPEPFGWTDLAPIWTAVAESDGFLPALRPGCDQVELWLDKGAP